MLRRVGTTRATAASGCCLTSSYAGIEAQPPPRLFSSGIAPNGPASALATARRSATGGPCRTGVLALLRGQRPMHACDGVLSHRPSLAASQRGVSFSSQGWMARTRLLLVSPKERDQTKKFFEKDGSSLKDRSEDDSSGSAKSESLGRTNTEEREGDVVNKKASANEESQQGTIAPSTPADTATIHRATAGEHEKEVGEVDGGAAGSRTAPSLSARAPDADTASTDAQPAATLASEKSDKPSSESGKVFRKDGVEISEDPSKIPVFVVVTKVMALLWPKGETKVKLLVASSVACVLLAKVLKVAVPFWFKSIVDLLAPTATAASVTATLGPFTVGVFGCVVAYGICRTTASVAEELKTFLFAPVGGHASTKLAMEMFTKLHNLDLHFHLNRETGVLSKDLDRGSRAFWSLAYALLFMVVPTVFEMMLVCGALNTQAGPEFIGIAVVAVISYVAWTYCVTNWRAKFRTRYNNLDSRVGGLIVDSLLNYETVKYFGSEKYERARIGTETTKMNAELVRLDQTMALLNFGQQAIFVTASVLSLYLATCGVVAGAMTVGDLVLIDALLMQLYMPLSYLGMIYREIQTSTQNMQAMIALLNQENHVKEAPNAKPYEYVNGTIELKNVNFEYTKDDGRMVLKNLSLVIPGGKTVAFVGPSGSGKSTIFRILFRFYDPVGGEIYFDGQPLSKLKLSTVRDKIGVVPQDTVLFNESVQYNIRYGKMDATDEQVVEAAKKASLDETVQRMSDGYDTSVGERGLKLSGGEKQRVAIARVVLQDPPILLADEATSALDSTTESNVMQTVKSATGRDKPRTIILIAHRLTTVKEADVIFVLDGKGGLGEQGNHYELLARGGLYADMWFQQLRDSRKAAGDPDHDAENEAGGAERKTGGDADKATNNVA